MVFAEGFDVVAAAGGLITEAVDVGPHVGFLIVEVPTDLLDILVEEADDCGIYVVVGGIERIEQICSDVGKFVLEEIVVGIVQEVNYAYGGLHRRADRGQLA